MIKHVIKGQEEPETTTIEWWLETNGKHIKLVGRDSAGMKDVLFINEIGFLHINQDAELYGLKTDSEGRILIPEDH